MYSAFPHRTYYVYVADERGEALPVFDRFGYRTTFLKRVYDRKASEIVRGLYREHEERTGEDDPGFNLMDLPAEQLRPAGDEALAWLVKSNRRKPQHRHVGPIQLVQVTVERVGDELVKKPLVVGRHGG